MHIVMDDVHKIEFIIGGVCLVLLLLFVLWCEIDIKIYQWKLKRDMKKKGEDKNNENNNEF